MQMRADYMVGVIGFNAIPPSPMKNLLFSMTCLSIYSGWASIATPPAFLLSEFLYRHSSFCAYKAGFPVPISWSKTSATDLNLSGYFSEETWQCTCQKSLCCFFHFVKINFKAKAIELLYNLSFVLVFFC